MNKKTAIFCFFSKTAPKRALDPKSSFGPKSAPCGPKKASKMLRILCYDPPVLPKIGYNSNEFANLGRANEVKKTAFLVHVPRSKSPDWKNLIWPLAQAAFISLSTMMLSRMLLQRRRCVFHGTDASSTAVSSTAPKVLMLLQRRWCCFHRRQMHRDDPWNQSPPHRNACCSGKINFGPSASKINFLRTKYPKIAPKSPKMADFRPIPAIFSTPKSNPRNFRP